jgi:hypothetical protein
MEHIGKISIFTGLILIVAGIILFFAGDKLSWLGHLPSHSFYSLSGNFFKEY